MWGLGGLGGVGGVKPVLFFFDYQVTAICGAARGG